MIKPEIKITLVDRIGNHGCHRSHKEYDTFDHDTERGKLCPMAMHVFFPYIDILRHDVWAIAVHLMEDDKLGFITRFKNKTIARLMNAGKKFIGVVDDPATDAEAKEIADKELHRNRRAPTENMAIPFLIYLVEQA